MLCGSAKVYDRWHAYGNALYTEGRKRKLFSCVFDSASRRNAGVAKLYCPAKVGKLAASQCVNGNNSLRCYTLRNCFYLLWGFYSRVSKHSCLYHCDLAQIVSINLFCKAFYVTGSEDLFSGKRTNSVGSQGIVPKPYCQKTFTTTAKLPYGFCYDFCTLTKTVAVHIECWICGGKGDVSADRSAKLFGGFLCFYGDVRYLKPSVFNNLVFDFHSLKLFRTACLRKALRRHIRSNAHFIHLSVISCKFLCVPTI